MVLLVVIHPTCWKFDALCLNVATRF